MSPYTTEFTPFQALAGGALIGLASMLLMALNGRIAGLTGILSGLLPPRVSPDWSWRLAYILAAAAAPAGWWLATGSIPSLEVPVGTPSLAVGGFIVGIGVVFGAGCTSGHGICGLARLSPRSLVAVATFMLTAATTVFIARHVVGG